MPLTERSLKNAKSASRPYKLSDGEGLYVEVAPNGSRYWRLKYRFAQKEKRLAFGLYPEVSLEDARDARYEARKLLRNGIDPGEHKKLLKRSGQAAAANTFKAVALEWLAKQTFAPATLEKARWTFDDLLFPYIGARPIRELTPAELLPVFQKLEIRGKRETAHRTKQRAGQVIRYAIATGRADRDPTADLRGALAPIKVTNRAAITNPKKVGELLRAIRGYSGQPTTEAAFKLAPLLFVRPGELRAAEWAEFDLDKAEWRIPAHRMKMGEQHIVPLSTQAVAILRELQPLSCHSRYVFPSLRTIERPMSENTITAALRRMGYSGEEMSWHGFRAMASTLLNEQGFAPDVIELQLAHSERDQVRAAYNRAQRLEDRRKMMQAWSDYLDGLAAQTGAQD